ncbi:MAG: DUF2442 domain-containing protein [Cyanobacteria bacterium P01_D01_bin.44]
MTALTLELEPIVERVSITAEQLIVDLVDGRSLSIPLSWYPRLLYASQKARQNRELLGDGYAVEWPDLDEHIGIDGFIAGRRSSESSKSLNAWLQKAGQLKFDCPPRQH